MDESRGDNTEELGHLAERLGQPGSLPEEVAGRVCYSARVLYSWLVATPGEVNAVLAEVYGTRGMARSHLRLQPHTLSNTHTATRWLHAVRRRARQPWCHIHGGS